MESHVGAYEFQDYNGDGIKDILIQNISDVRSNWTYYLYLMDLKHDRLTKIKNFNQIKNPHYLPEYNLIDNEVMSGRNWTSFYQIRKDTIFDFGYVIYDGEDDNGNTVDFEKEYDKTLSKVLKNKDYSK
ncbi:XAC2610-related protein [Chryseobacterium gambrini]|uniref:XAC2610-related protein n=1 Tax=Chryseobacterium gambrini TaxID=373672 RepID=UPI003BA44F44